MDRGILGLFDKNVAASKYWFTNTNPWGPNTKKYKTPAQRQNIALHLGIQQCQCYTNDINTKKSENKKKTILTFSENLVHFEYLSCGTNTASVRTCRMNIFKFLEML